MKITPGFFVIGFSLFISFFLTVINKLLPSKALPLKFEYPLLITCLQQLISLLCAFLHFHYSRTDALAERSLFYSKKSVMGVLPLALLFVVMVGMSTLCREYVEPTFHQVLRGFSLFNTLALTYGTPRSYSVARLTMASFIIIAGTWLGSSLSEYSVWPAIAFGVPYSFSFSLYLLYIKKTLTLVDGDVWTLIAYHSALSVLLLLPLVVTSRELYLLWTNGISFKIISWLTLLCLGMEGYVLTLLTFYQIKYTGPLTANICYIVKNQLQLVVLMLFWNNSISGKAAVGIAVTMFGSLLYCTL